MEGKLELDEIWKDIKWLMDGMMVMVKDLARSKGLDPDELLELNKSSMLQNLESLSSIPLPMACESSIFRSLEAGIQVADGAWQPSSLKLEGPKAAHNLFDKMPRLTSADGNEGKPSRFPTVVPNNDGIDFMGTIGLADDKSPMYLKSSDQQLKVLDPWIESENKHSIVEEANQSLPWKLVSLKTPHLLFSRMSMPMPIRVFGIDRGIISIPNNYNSVLVKAEVCFSDLYCHVENNLIYVAFGGRENDIFLVDNATSFLFDPGGCTLSQMDCNPSNSLGNGEQRGLCLEINVTDALVKAISHEPWIREAYGCGIEIEYPGIEKIDCEGRKIESAILRNVLDIFVVIRMEQRDYYGVEAAMLRGNSSHYSRQASSWIFENYCPDDILEAEECLRCAVHYQGCGTQLFVNEYFVLHSLLKVDRAGELPRMYKFFSTSGRTDQQQNEFLLQSEPNPEIVAGILRTTCIDDSSLDTMNHELHSGEHMIYNHSIAKFGCYLFDPGGGSFFMITWNLEIYMFLCGRDNATVIFLLCIKKEIALPTQPTTTMKLTIWNSDIYVRTASLHALTYTEHLLYAWLRKNDFDYQYTVVHGVIHKNIQCYDCFKPSQVSTRRCCDIEALLVGLDKKMLHSNVLIFGIKTMQQSITKQLHKPVNVNMVEGISKESLEESESANDKKSWALFVIDIKNLAMAICAHGLKTMARVKETRENLFEGVNAKLQNFVWDPSYRVMYSYIIEDNDVLKKNGIRVRLALKQDEGLNGKFAYYNAHVEFLDCSLFDLDLLLLLIIWPLFQLQELYDLIGSFVTFCSPIRTLFDSICTRINNDLSSASLPYFLLVLLGNLHSWIGSMRFDFEEAIDVNNLINAGSNMKINSGNCVQQNVYVQTILFELGYIAMTVPHKEMLKTFSLMRFQKHHWGSRKALVAFGTSLENFVWNPGPYVFRISLFPILEDKDVLKGKVLSRTKLVAILFMLFELFKCFS